MVDEVRSAAHEGRSRPGAVARRLGRLAQLRLRAAEAQRGAELGPQPWAIDGTPVDVRLPSVLGDGHSDANASKITAGKRWLTSELVGAQSGAETKGAHAVYAGALPGVDVDLSAVPSGLKESLTLADATATTDFQYVISLSQGLKPRIEASGVVVVEDAKGAVFRIPRPSVVDAKDAAGPSPRYKLEESGPGHWSLSFSVDRLWLQNAHRAWPVVVDPTTGVVTSNAATTLMCPWGGHDVTAVCNDLNVADYQVGFGHPGPGRPAADGGADLPAGQRCHRLGASQALSDVDHEPCHRSGHHSVRQHSQLDDHGAEPA